MTSNHETYLLMASTQNDMEDWVKTIRRVIWAPFGGGQCNKTHIRSLLSNWLKVDVPSKGKAEQAEVELGSRKRVEDWLSKARGGLVLKKCVKSWVVITKLYTVSTYPKLTRSDGVALQDSVLCLCLVALCPKVIWDTAGDVKTNTSIKCVY